MNKTQPAPATRPVNQPATAVPPVTMETRPVFTPAEMEKLKATLHDGKPETQQAQQARLAQRHKIATRKAR